MTLDELRASGAAVLTVAAVASLLEIDERTVSRAIADKQIPSIQVGRRVLIPRERLLHMLTEENTLEVA